jgi:hypothetical protein
MKTTNTFIFPSSLPPPPPPPPPPLHVDTLNTIVDLSMPPPLPHATTPHRTHRSRSFSLSSQTLTRIEGRPNDAKIQHLKCGGGGSKTVPLALLSYPERVDNRLTNLVKRLDLLEVLLKDIVFWMASLPSSMIIILTLGSPLGGVLARTQRWCWTNRMEFPCPAC